MVFCKDVLTTLSGIFLFLENEVEKNLGVVEDIVVVDDDDDER